MKSKKIINLSSSKVAEMIKNLGLVVVSLDHMGSTFYDDRKHRAIELDKFFGPKISQMLARTRGILSEAFNSQSTKSDIARLEEEAELLPYWKPKKSVKKGRR